MVYGFVMELLYCTTEAHTDIYKIPDMVVVFETLIGRVLIPTAYMSFIFSDRPLCRALKMLGQSDGQSGLGLVQLCCILLLQSFTQDQMS